MHDGQDLDDHTSIAAEHARRAIADADTKLARYRAALESGTDPALIATWTAEVTAAKTTAQAQLRALTGRRRTTEDEIAAIVAAAGNVLAVLRDADPDDKAAIYRQLGLNLTYQPGTRTVLAEANPSAIMYESECPRGDLTLRPVHTCKGQVRMSLIEASRRSCVKPFPKARPRGSGYSQSPVGVSRKPSPVVRSVATPSLRRGHRQLLAAGQVSAPRRASASWGSTGASGSARLARSSWPGRAFEGIPAVPHVVVRFGRVGYFGWISCSPWWSAKS
jgi:hypothetical protein